MHADWDERISSLTDKAIKEGLQNLKNGNEYDKLYFAAKALAEADFWWGSTRHKLFR